MNPLASFRSLLKKLGQKGKPFSRALRAHLSVEGLEARLIPYVNSGNLWPHPELVTLSFMPNGTNLGGGNSNLLRTFDNHANPHFRANWRKEVLRTAQSWAQQTNVNFALVSDNGAASGSGLYQQGDPGFGDIRIGGMNLGPNTLASAYLPPPVNNYSIAGDFNFNTNFTFNLNATYDLFTVAAHEFGHGLGLLHSGLCSPVMYGYYNAIKSSLRTDDISGIRNIYSANLGRSQDSYDAAASNGSFATATPLTSLIDSSSLTALVQDLDVTTTADLDYYSFVAPAGTNGTMQVNIQSSGLSLLSPLVKVYDANQLEIGSASGLNQYGATLTVTLNNVTAGQQFYVMVDGADNTAFGTGKYALTLNFGTNPTPVVPLPDTRTLNGNTISGGGGKAARIDYESLVNTTTAGAQQTTAESPQAVAMDANGNYVVVWMSSGQDGSGWGVHARRFDADGVALGDEFRVNTTTAGNQQDPAVAMNAGGSFVIAWTSSGQDDDGSGVYAQRFDAAGMPQGGEFQVNTTTAGDAEQPTVALAAAGSFIIAWTDSDQDGDGSGVYAQRFDAAGTAQGAEFRVNTTTAGDQMTPAAATDAGGNFVIAWSSNGQDGSGWGVYAQRYDAAGVALGPEFRVNTATTNDQQDPAAAMNSAGDFVITWSSKNQDGDDWGVYAQRYNAAGVGQGDEFLVNTTTVKDQQDPAVALDNAGGFLVTWSNYTPGAKAWDIYTRQYDRLGAPMDSEFRVNTTTTTGNQEHASIALNDYGQVVVAWSGKGAGDADGVFTQRYAINGGNGMNAGMSDEFSTVTHEDEHEHHQHQQQHQDERGDPDSQAAAAAQIASALAPSDKASSPAAAPVAPAVESSAEDADWTAAPATSQGRTDGLLDVASQTDAARDALFTDFDRLADVLSLAGT